MRRLNATKGLTLSEATRQGDLQMGPAIIPSFQSLHSVDLPSLNILFGNSKNIQSMRETYVASLVASVESALHSWNTCIDVINVIKGDIQSGYSNMVRRYFVEVGHFRFCTSISHFSIRDVPVTAFHGERIHKSGRASSVFEICQKLDSSLGRRCV